MKIGKTTYKPHYFTAAKLEQIPIPYMLADDVDECDRKYGEYIRDNHV